MNSKLIQEYIETAEGIHAMEIQGSKAIRKWNKMQDRMRAIVVELASKGNESIKEFLVVLDSESAAVSAAHHLVELAEIDSETTNKCFKLVELAMKKQENSGNVANALGEKMWLKEWPPPPPPPR